MPTRGVPTPQSPTPEQRKGTGIFSRLQSATADRLGEAWSSRVKKLTEIGQRRKQGEQTGAETLLQSGNVAFGFATDPLAAAVGGVGETFVPESVKSSFGKTAGAVATGVDAIKDWAKKNPKTSKAITDAIRSYSPTAGAAMDAAKVNADIEGLKETNPRLYEDATALRNILTAVSFEEPAAKATGVARDTAKQAIPSPSGIMSRVAETTAPAVSKATEVATTGAGIAGEVASSAGSQMLAMSPQTVKAIVEGKVSKEAMASLDRVSLASRAKEGIGEALDDLSGLGAEYEDLRLSGQTVKIPVGPGKLAKPLTDALKKYGLTIGEDGRIVKSINSKPFDEQTAKAIQEFVDTYGQTGQITADQFLNVRQAADKIVDWNSRNASLANSFAKTLRGNYDAIGKKGIKGLAELDIKFSPMHQELGMLQRDFLTSGGELKDTALSSLANLSSKGKEQVLKRLEKYVPGISKEIHILKAVEDIASAQGIKVGTYARGIAIGGAALANPVAGALVFVATHPAVAVPLLRAYGELKRSLLPKIEAIIKKVSLGKKLTDKESKLALEAFSGDVKGGEGFRVPDESGYSKVFRESPQPVRKLADQLMRDESAIWDRLGITSGSQLSDDPALVVEYLKAVHELPSFKKVQHEDVQGPVSAILEDENHHTLNSLLLPKALPR